MKSSSQEKDQKVYVAMSGGVDSSVAAALLIKEGYDVEGVTMCFNIPDRASRRPSCCGIEGINDARQAAKILGIHHHVLDFAQDLEHFIIEDFVEEYQRGHTPNPCVRCNQFLKFGSLFDLIRKDGADFLATGHYVRRDYNSKEKIFQLSKARDALKDQTYFLYGISQDVLAHTLFPLGDYSKDDVRELAKKFGLNTALKQESQDICFVTGEDYKEFIKKRTGEKGQDKGVFKDRNGNILGEHQGIINFTIGQREKLGLALGKPVYVYKIDAKNNTVYVGDKDLLLSRGLIADQANWVSIRELQQPLEVKMKIRYNSQEVCGVLTLLEDGLLQVIFDCPQKAVTPGQSVVFYDDQLLLGGAVIREAIKKCE